jgi:hypothetical protein
MTTAETDRATRPAEGAPSPLALLFAPDRAQERQARAGRAWGYLLFAWAGSLLLAAARATRVDAVSATLRKLEMSGQLQGMSDRQIADEAKNAERVFQVSTIAKSVLGVPLSLGLACLALLILAWFFRGKVKGSAVAPVAAATMLPAALGDLLDAAVAFRHATLPPEAAPLAPRTLTAALAVAGRPLLGPLARLGEALDFFSLWAALLMAFGLAAAADVPRRTALTGTVIAWVCWQLLTRVAMGG